MYGPNYHEWLLKVKDEFDPLWVCHPPVPLAHDEFVDRAPMDESDERLGKPEKTPYAGVEVTRGNHIIAPYGGQDKSSRPP